MKDVYALKMLYFNAGKNLLSDSRRYYSNLVSDAKIESAADSIMKINGQNMNIMLCDSALAAADALLSKVGKEYEKNAVFYFEDDEADGVLSAMYVPEENMFIYNDKYGNFDRCLLMGLMGCYNHGGCRKYSPGQCLDIAKYYYDKAEYLEKKGDL